MDFSDIERILELVRQHDLSEFELERDGLKLRVRKAGNEPALTTQLVRVAPAAASLPAAPASASASAPPAPPVATDGEEMPDAVELAVVKSPIVGTFYRSP